MLSSTDYHELLQLRRDFEVLYAEWKQIFSNIPFANLVRTSRESRPAPEADNGRVKVVPPRLRASHPKSLQRLGNQQRIVGIKCWSICFSAAPFDPLGIGPHAEHKPTNVIVRAFPAGPCPLCHFETRR